MPQGPGTYGSSVGRPKKRGVLRGVFNRLIKRRSGKKKVLNSGDSNQGNDGGTYNISDQP